MGPLINIQTSTRIEFNLPDNTVNSGDTSVITLPEELRLEKNMTFNVVDDTGAVVAIAQTDGSK